MTEFYVLEFTTDRAQVLWDIWSGSCPSDVAAQVADEYGGVIYSVDGPFETEDAALKFLEEMGKA